MKDPVPQLTYLGVIPGKKCREYRFRIEDKDKTIRRIVLTIDNYFFQEHHLMFQEAPDLCYQKMQLDLINETSHSPLSSLVPITGTDIGKYRDSHPTTKEPQFPGVGNSTQHSEAV